MLRELYNGTVTPGERRYRKNETRRAISDKIEGEEQYFAEKLSPEDCEKFQNLSRLYTELSLHEEGDVFAYGFTMGVLLMMDVMEEADAMATE